ncbi:hypothetical protein [Streptomyces sp. NPDC005898]|uniref:hypothetical protein n=1 Tax=Streptomyces sp. NPDC005898 TaxID=3157082 RepID=UPI00340EE2DC
MTDANKRTVRTVIQGIVGFAVALPAIVDASGVPESLPWVAAGLAAAGGLARVMALPSVEALLDRFGLGLVDTAPDAGGTPK